MIKIARTYPASPAGKQIQSGLAVLLCAVILMAAGPVLAQAVSEDEVGGVSVDPISIRGPKPSDRFDEIKIDQKLDAQVPLDAQFLDETGKTVTLGDYFGKDRPVLLTLVYYECPMLCTMVLNHTASALNAVTMKLEPGQDYDIVTISVDPDETPALAAAKKAEYLKMLGRDGAAAGWHFLTGKEDDIQAVATSVGFRYYYDSQIDQYAHASGIMFLTESGRVSSYYLGLDYRPNNVRMAMVDAAEGKIGSLVDQLVLLCYDYDPSTGHYGFYIMGALRLAGGITVFGILVFWYVMYRTSRREPQSDGANHAAEVIS